MVTGEIYDQMKYFNRYPTRSLTPPFETFQIFTFKKKSSLVNGEGNYGRIEKRILDVLSHSMP